MNSASPDATCSLRWLTIERLYHEALALEDEARQPFLLARCAGDDALLGEVQSLLAHDGDAAFLDTPAVIPRATPGLSPGAVIGPYVVVEPIGEGGMGEVYRAHDRSSSTGPPTSSDNRRCQTVSDGFIRPPSSVSVSY